MRAPDMGTWSYRYDPSGKLLKQRDARDKGVCFYYDDLGRLEGKTYHDNVTNVDNLTCSGQYAVTYTYDDTAGGGGTNKGIGRRTGMSDASGSAAWIFDIRGRVTKETKAITGSGTFVTQWAYDVADRVKTMTYPGGNASQTGEAVNYAYNTAGLVYSASGTNTYLYSATYNALGQPLNRFMGSSSPVVKQTYTYDADIFRLSTLAGGTTPNYNNDQNIAYTYDARGNIRFITDTAALMGSTQVQTYTYGTVDRLSTAEVGGGSAGAYSQVSYGYDASGNISQFESGGANLYYQDTAHRHAVTHVGGTTSQYQKYWYDANGNVTRRISNTLDITLTYDYENHVAGISGSVSYAYAYDGDGKLVKMTIAGTTTALVGNWYEWTNNTAKVYYYAGATRLAVRDNGTLYYLLADHLGSTAVTTQSDGASQAELRYMAFGLTRLKSGTQKTPYRYTGQRVEGALDIYFYNARWYDPVVGRFLQPDTIVPNPGNPQSLNRYTYVHNNPLRYTDPTGHFTEEELLGWFGLNWRELFKQYQGWEQLLLKAQLGDAVLFGGDSSNPLLAVFATEGKNLVLWSIATRSAAGVTDIAQGSDSGVLSLYRSKNANQNGGGSQTYFLGENISPNSALFDGSDSYLHVTGSLTGPSHLTLPHEWYRGSRSHVFATGFLSGFELGLDNYAEGAAFAVTLMRQLLSGTPAWGALGRAIGGGPIAVGLAIVDIATAARWDTRYEVLDGAGYPLVVEVPEPPAHRR